MPKPKEGYNIDMSYPFYKERQKKKKILPRELYREICKEVNKEISKACINGLHIELPFKLGILKVIKRKTNYNLLRVDFNETRKQGEVVYHTNVHSDGWYGSWKWQRFTSHIGRSFNYVFRPTEANSDSVAKVLKERNGHKTYTT